MRPEIAIIAIAIVGCSGPSVESPSAPPDAPACERPPLEPCPAEAAAVRIYADAACSVPVVRIVDACPAVSSVTARDGVHLAGDVVEPDEFGAVRLYMSTNCGCVAYVMPSNATYYVGCGPTEPKCRER